MDGIIVPGGFGDRGIEGMIQAAQYARENHVPCFGICLVCRSWSLNLPAMCWATRTLIPASSPGRCPQRHLPDAGPAGQYPQGRHHASGQVPLHGAPGTKMAECYGESEIWERHRHRYEFNNDFRQEMQDAGWSFPALARTAIWWRLWSCPAATSIWVHSSTGVQEPPQPRTSPVQGLYRRCAALPRCRPAGYAASVIA